MGNRILGRHQSTFEAHFERMLRGLLRDSEAAKSLFEKMGLFKTPELLEKYVIASEVTVEVLDLFLSRVFGTERASFGNASVDLKTLWESLSVVSLNEGKEAIGEDSSARADEHNKEVEVLRVKVQDMERQLCALQRQLHMQGEVSQLAVALDGRLDDIARECERRVSDVMSQVSVVSEDVVHLKKDVSERASIGDVMGLREEVSRLKDGEERLELSILNAKMMTDVDQVLRDELQGEIKRLDGVVKMIIDPLNPGIISHLTRECGGNVHVKGVVEVTASSCFGEGWEAKNAVELGTDSRFCSKKEPNSWIQYDFKERRVSLTSYSIRSSAGPGFPRSWVLEVSNNGSEGSWHVVDCRENNEDLKSQFVTRNFAIRDPARASFRFVRLRLTGKNHNGNDTLLITSFEVFGTLSA